MKIDLLNQLKEVAVEVAKEAGEELLKRYKNFNRLDVNLKYSYEIVTKADIKSEKIIINKIKKFFPNHNILSEERGKIEGKDDYLWIVDPLDGTTNFSMHNPLWSISLAVARKEEIILGVVYAPALNEIYLAEKGKGFKVNSKKMRVSSVNSGKIINTFCHGSRKKDIEKAIKYYNYQKINNLDCRQLGSAAVELAYVAAGRIESIVIPGANSWDVAAGVLLVREAGGKVTDFNGKEWGLKSKDVAASNGKVHNSILRVLRKI